MPCRPENAVVRLCELLALVATVLCVAPNARADENEPAPAPAEDRVWKMRYSLALIGDPISAAFSPAPYGFVGGSIGYAPAPWLTVDAGVGATGAGAQFTLMPRARLIFGQDAVSLGAGVSVGAYQWDSIWYDSGGDHWKWSPAWRANIELSYERRAVSGLTVRPHIGLANILNLRGGACTADGGSPCSPQYADQPTNPFVYVGLAIGYGFE